MEETGKYSQARERWFIMLSIMKDKIEMIHLIQGKGDGKMNCYSCGVRMTIVEVAKNRYEGATMDKGYEVIAWCNECVPVGVKE